MLTCDSSVDLTVSRSSVPRSTAAADPEWREAWAAAWTAARSAWPGVDVDEAAFTDEVVRRLPPDLAPVSGLASLRVSDLYLVCACLFGQADALRAFESSFGPQLAAAARRGGATAPDEVVACLRERLLVGPGAKLRDYAGSGSLARWLKIAAHRLAIDMGRCDRVRGNDPASRDDGDLVDRISSGDPELQLLKRRYREVFRRAFARAMAALSPRARVMLRLHLIHGLSIDEIAPMQQVHRATAARWLAAARDEVLHGSRAQLGRMLAADAHEIESIMHLIASGLDVSMARHLEPKNDD